MRKFVVILFASLAVSSWTKGVAEEKKKLTDAEISKQLVGQWLVEEGDGKSFKFKGLNNYKKDGTIEATATLTLGEKSRETAVSGTWKVSDGMIIITVTKSNVPELIREGQVIKDQVLSIDEMSLKYKTEDGDEKVRNRIKK